MTTFAWCKRGIIQQPKPSTLHKKAGVGIMGAQSYQLFFKLLEILLDFSEKVSGYGNH